ncbi:hypothetical protein C1A40_12815 [Tamlana carrageenivorans]|uniref:FAS1 domain-containing protein n=2 Tax=Pseudotamlana carrageenivorans TaxID=2069432 RepID=A0A2I7SK50_9FLAO|nr:hypothetical protein C1A40_12815 [Tamlana carrageenivorans]
MGLKKEEIMKIYIKSLVIVGLLFVLSSCTLDVQEQFNFKPENTYADPFENLTAWEYIQSRTTTDIADDLNRKVLNQEELDFMIAAIKHVGFEDLYSQTATRRTYFLLNNNAFTGGNADRDIIRAVTGTTQAPTARVNADSLMATITEPYQINRLKAILKYHIVEEEVQQVPKITIFDKDFIFNTLLPQVNIDAATGQPSGLSSELAPMALRRDIEWEMEANNLSAPLIDTAIQPGFNEKIRSHNYVFNNGVGHYLNDTVRYYPYPFYDNFTVN